MTIPVNRFMPLQTRSIAFGSGSDRTIKTVIANAANGNWDDKSKQVAPQFLQSKEQQKQTIQESIKSASEDIFQQDLSKETKK